MMDKNIGQGSQYLWTYHDAEGNYLDGVGTTGYASRQIFRSRTFGQSSCTTR
jgi:hypothetical protein